MQLTNFYYSFKDAISKETCEEIIKLGTQEIATLKEKGVNTEGYTFGHNERGANPDAKPQQEYTKEQLSKQGIDKTYIRDSEVAWLNAPWIYDAVVPFIKDANKLADWEFEWDWCESAQFTVYQPGGFYSCSPRRAGDAETGPRPSGLRSARQIPHSVGLEFERRRRWRHRQATITESVS